jgi:hypothetical protein
LLCRWQTESWIPSGSRHFDTERSFCNGPIEEMHTRFNPPISNMIQLRTARHDRDMAMWLSQYFQCIKIREYSNYDPDERIIFTETSIYGVAREPIIDYNEKYTDQLIFHKLSQD